MRMNRGIALLVWAACGLPALASTPETYVSIGDSLAYGMTTYANAAIPTYGDQGYVSRYANYLATQSGGVRPTVVNLAIIGETSSSYGDTSNIYRVTNLNYAGSPLSQAQMFAATVASQQGSGHAITHVSVSIGPDDLLNVTDQPGFFNLSVADQQALLGAALNSLAANYAGIVGQVRALVPSAELVIVGDYNPFAAVPDSPFYAEAPAAVQAINGIAANLAATFGGRYIDTYSLFLGHEAEYTHILDDAPAGSNIHPNDLGYDVIGNAMIPAPSTLVLVGLGVVGAKRRRR